MPLLNPKFEPGKSATPRARPAIRRLSPQALHIWDFACRSLSPDAAGRRGRLFGAVAGNEGLDNGKTIHALRQLVPVLGHVDERNLDIAHAGELCGAKACGGVLTKFIGGGQDALPVYFYIAPNYRRTPRGGIRFQKGHREIQKQPRALKSAVSIRHARPISSNIRQPPAGPVVA